MKEKNTLTGGNLINNNMFKITKQIHSEIERINQKYNLEIEVDSDYCYDEDGTEWNSQSLEIELRKHKINTYLKLESPQIRQILVGLQEVLGDNPEYASTREKYENLDVCCWERVELLVKSQAEALCERWLDGLEPMFDSEPEKVLEELLEILKEL